MELTLWNDFGRNRKATEGIRRSLNELLPFVLAKLQTLFDLLHHQPDVAQIQTFFEAQEHVNAVQMQISSGAEEAHQSLHVARMQTPSGTVGAHQSLNVERMQTSPTAEEALKRANVIVTKNLNLIGFAFLSVAMRENR